MNIKLIIINVKLDNKFLRYITIVRVSVWVRMIVRIIFRSKIRTRFKLRLQWVRDKRRLSARVMVSIKVCYN